MTTQDLKEFRRYIHKNPELSNEEVNTAHLIVERLRALNPGPAGIITGLGGHGVMAEFDSGIKGPSIMIRAELDALPIQEVSDIEHRSDVDNVSHMCGHDGHMSILLGLAQHFNKNRLQKGKLYLLWQPGEENGTGAKAIISDPKFENLNFDYVLALHNLPSYPLHEIVVRYESFTAHVISMIVRLNGKTSHAAEPEQGINPAGTIAEIIRISDLLNNNDVNSSDFFLVTPVYMTLGDKAYGISAGYGEVHLTLRAWDKETLQKKSSKLLHTIGEKAENAGVSLSHEWDYEFFANRNDKSTVDLIKEAAKEMDLGLTAREYAFKWGEDFGLFTQKFRGAMFGLGSGENQAALHNPDYDFPDELLETGVSIFSRIVQKIIDSDV